MHNQTRPAFSFLTVLIARMIKLESKDYPQGAVKLSEKDMDPRLEYPTDPLTYRVE